MDQGRVIADDTAPALKRTLAGDLLTFRFADREAARSAVPVLARLTGRDVGLSDSSATVTVPDGDRLLPTALRELDTVGLPVRAATGVPPTLDDVFLALTGRSLREAHEAAATDTESEADVPAAQQQETVR